MSKIVETAVVVVIGLVTTFVPLQHDIQQEVLELKQKVAEQVEETYETNTTTEYSQEEINFAAIIEGEAPSEMCSFQAQLAVAHIYQRNKTMYGWKEPSNQALEIARTWMNYDDPTFGSVYIMNWNDVQQPRVQSLIGVYYAPTWEKRFDYPAVTTFDCVTSVLYTFR